MENAYVEQQGWSINTINELVQDWGCFEFILELKRRMTDIEVKNYISIFLKTLAPLLVYEVANALEVMGIKKKDEFFNQGMKKKVQLERNKFTKKIIVNSSASTEIIQKMGLNFDELVYDMNIIMSNGKLVDMNFETYIESIKDDFEFWNSLFGMPKSMLNALLNAFNIGKTVEELYIEINGQLDQIAEKVEKDLSCKRYSYSVYKLFAKDAKLEFKDKIFILYRYRLITSIRNFEKALPSIEISLGENMLCNTASFFRKYRAAIIKIIYREIEKIETDFVKGIKEDVNKQIVEEDFWVLNGRLRNNIHYVETVTFKNDEIKLIDRYQKIYFDIIERHVMNCIYIDIDEECECMTNFLKECLDKNVDRDELKKNYENYYLKYYYTGTLD